MENKRDIIEYFLFWLSISAITFLLLIGQLYAQPTKKEVYEELIKANLINPKAAFQIIMVETGHLKSRIALEDHNLFGLHNGCSYLQFDSWRECISYFAKLECKMWDKYHKSGDYYDFIAWWGYKTGKSCSVKDIKYSEYLKRIKVHIY